MLLRERQTHQQVVRQAGKMKTADRQTHSVCRVKLRRQRQGLQPSKAESEEQLCHSDTVPFQRFFQMQAKKSPSQQNVCVVHESPTPKESQDRFGHEGSIR